MIPLIMVFPWLLAFSLVVVTVILAPGVWSRKPERRKAVRDLLASITDLVRALFRRT